MIFVEKGKAANIPLQEGRHSQFWNSRLRCAVTQKHPKISGFCLQRSFLFFFIGFVLWKLTVFFRKTESNCSASRVLFAHVCHRTRKMLYSHISVLVSFFSQESVLPHKLQKHAELAPRKSFTERGGSRATRASLCSHQTNQYGLKVECTGNGPWKFGAG